MESTSLELESTESSLMQDTSQAIEILGQFREIAEGMENEEERIFLREQWCDWVQGYLVVMPQPADVSERFIPRQ